MFKAKKILKLLAILIPILLIIVAFIAYCLKTGNYLLLLVPPLGIIIIICLLGALWDWLKSKFPVIKVLADILSQIPEMIKDITSK